jgi:hypothetical protein
MNMTPYIYIYIKQLAADNNLLRLGVLFKVDSTFCLPKMMHISLSLIVLVFSKKKKKCISLSITQSDF